MINCFKSGCLIIKVYENCTFTFVLDWTKTTVCNTDRDCRGPGFAGQCSKVDGGTYDKSGTRYFGWCTPSDCGDHSGCPDIGDICTEGMISGECNANGKCVYQPFQAIAGCVNNNYYNLPSEPRNEEDWKVFQYCDTDANCQNSKCSAVNNAQDSNGIARVGVCVPLECSADIPCPNVGDQCTSGTIHGTCQNGECSYDPFRAIAECIDSREPEQGKSVAF